VAEGVESRAQMDFLQARGCDAMQGFYFKPPLPAIDLALLLPAVSAAGADATA
jgi:EAL domain-containing protein (putative c-di-GMP-specific phosphodiesterase class I)